MITSVLSQPGAGHPAVMRWRQLRAEVAANPRLRLGLYLIAGTLWLWLLLLAQDQAVLWRAEADEAGAELERLKPLQAATQWPQRAEDARKHLEAARAMLWTAPSQGLAEAALQDNLRSWADKAGLPVRELNVSAAPATEATANVAGLVNLRARMVVDLNRIGLMSLLAEIGRSPKIMVVDTLRMRLVAQPARAELEVRVLYRAEERKP
nr:GspMb/PilO family protein [uncultured Roseateles sp.]